MRIFNRFPGREYKRRVVAYPFYEQVQYAIDFQTAASTLASTMTGRPEDDRLLMPVLLLYRHSFELRLKVMLARLDITPEVDGGQGLASARDRNTHNLKKLLDEYTYKGRGLLDDSFPDDLKKIICELHDLDPGGMAFRYADSSNVDASAHIDLPAMADCLEAGLNTLSSLQDYVEDRAGWNS